MNQEIISQYDYINMTTIYYNVPCSLCKKPFIFVVPDAMFRLVPPMHEFLDDVVEEMLNNAICYICQIRQISDEIGEMNYGEKEKESTSRVQGNSKENSKKAGNINGTGWSYFGKCIKESFSSRKKKKPET